MSTSTNEQARPQTGSSLKSLSFSLNDKMETLKRSPTQAKWSGSSEPVICPDLSWLPPFPPREGPEPCISYQMMAKECGCIFTHRRETMAHVKTCLLSRPNLTEEEHAAFLQSAQKCPAVIEVHQFLNRPCPNHKAPGGRIKSTKDKVKTRLRSFGRSSSKYTLSPEEEQAEAERVPKLIQMWQDRIEMEQIEAERKAKARIQNNQDAYNAHIAHLRLEEVNAGIPEDERFYLFDFFGREGGDLLKPFSPRAGNTPHKCAYCEQSDSPGRLEVLPCNCVVHRQCAADRFIQSQWKPLEKPTCVCKMPKDKDNEEGKPRTFNLTRLLTNFEDPK